MPEVAKRRWDVHSNGPLTEESVRGLFVPAWKYRVSVGRYPSGTSFGGRSRAGTRFVISGECRFNACPLVTGDVLDTPAGEFQLDVVGPEDLVIVSAWELPPEVWPPNA